MKAIKYTTTTLIALMIATASIQAQSARRPASDEKKARTTVSRTPAKQATKQKARTTQPSRKAQTTQRAHSNQNLRKAPAQTKQKARTTQPARKAQTTQRTHSNQNVRKAPAQSNQKARTTQPARKAQTTQRTHSKQNVRKAPARQPMSMTTTKNPRSTYRQPNNRVSATPRHDRVARSAKYRDTRYYGGNHYHYAYPTRNVKFHYHHDTYVNNFRVLYYPSYTNIYWSRNMYHDYRRWYPDYRWSYNYGHRIQTISAFDAKFNLGEVAMVYGRVYATWYNQETDDFLLFFGGDFPYQEFTVVLPGHVARKFNWRPERYFLGEHITITGLITTFDGSPEIVVKKRRQIDIY